MSQENVEVLRRFASHWQSGNRESYRRYLHGDVELATDPGWPGGGVWRGAEEVGRFLDSYSDAFITEERDVTDFLDAGDQVVVRSVDRVVGRGSGAPTENTFTAVYTIQDGLVSRIRFFFSHQEALEAAGLSE